MTEISRLSILDPASTPPLRANRDYRLLLTGSTVNLLGSAMTSLAITLLAVKITGSAGKAGLITAMYGIGQWIAMLPAGTLVDRWDRKRTMVATTAAGAVAIGGMFLNVGINGAVTVGILALQLGGTSPTALGLMESVIGATGIVAALAAPAVLQRARIGTITRAGFAAVGLVGCLLAVRISIWWIGAMMCLAVLCVAPVNAGMGAYTMRTTPDEMQGRSGSASAFVSLAMMPLGTAGAGLLLEHLGARPAMAAFAVILVLGAVWTVLSRPIASIPLAGDLGEVPEVPADV